MLSEGDLNRPVPDVVVDSDSIDIDPPIYSNQDPQCSYSQDENNSNNKQHSNDEQKHAKKTEGRATPRRAQFANSRGTFHF